MKYLAVFLLVMSAESYTFIVTRDCFQQSEMDCMENFVDAIFYSNRGVDQCNELGKLVACSADSVDECFGDEHNREVEKGLEELENLYKDTCGAVSSGDNSDFDEEIYSHIQLTATIKKKKKSSHSTTDKKTSVSSDSKKCFNERKKICWDTFKNAVIHSVFYSSTGLDKCSVLRHFAFCIRTAADDCFEDKTYENADEFLEVWGKKAKDFCEEDTPDGEPVTSEPRPLVEDLECHVSEWSEWSSCSRTCGEGHKYRSRHLLRMDSRQRYFCSSRTTTVEEAPCSADCTMNITVTESLGSKLSESEDCFEEKNKICKNNVFKDTFYLFLSSRDISDTCSQIRIMLDCARRAASDCFKDDQDKEVDDVLKEFEHEFKMLCEVTRKILPELKFGLLMNTLSRDYQKREDCVDHSKNYIFKCIGETMEMADASPCDFWNALVKCMRSRIGETCGAKASARFEDRLPDISESMKKACKVYRPTSFNSRAIDEMEFYME